MKSNPLSALSILVPYLKKYRGRIIFVLSLVVIVGMVDMAQPYITKQVIDRFIAVPHPNFKAVWLVSIGYLLIVLMAFGLTYFQDILLQKTGQAVVRSIRIDLFRHIQSLSLKYFDTKPSGSIITNIVSDTEALNTFFTDFLANTLRGVFSLLLIVFFMLQLNAKIALCCFTMIPVIIAVSAFFQIKLRTVNQEMRSRLSASIAFLAENLNGMAIIQIFHQEKKQEVEYDNRNKALLKATIGENRMTLLFFLFTETMGDMGVAALVWFGGGAVLRGALTFGVLYAFIGYIRRFFQPINTITMQFNVLQSMIVASERIGNTMREQPDIVESPVSVVPDLRHKIQFDDISLAYRKGQDVLKNISLSIRPGERVGFVGASGAGKTSLINVLGRFYEVSKGAIKIDGRDIRRWPIADLRRTIGIVQQEVTLFYGTVLDNIRFFRKDISEERVIEASRLVGADIFIQKLPLGYSTIMTERGSTLSFGERQLLSFARAMVFDPKILVLDEATANLDSISEAILQEAIAKVSVGRTLLVIAHRLSTVQKMDYIVVLDHGKIVEKGTHEELLKANGHYTALHRSGILVEEVVL